MINQTYTVRLPADLRAGLDAWAGAIDRSPAWLVRRILSVALAEYEETPAGYHIEVSAVADDGTEDDDV